MSSSKGASFSESELEALGLWDVAEQFGKKNKDHRRGNVSYSRQFEYGAVSKSRLNVHSRYYGNVRPGMGLAGCDDYTADDGAVIHRFRRDDFGGHS